jgi:predicted lipoprotein
MPKRVFNGPFPKGADIRIGEDFVHFPDLTTAVEVTAEQAEALDAAGLTKPEAKPKAKPAADKSEEG